MNWPIPLHPRGWALWAIVAYFVLAGVFGIYIVVTQGRINSLAKRTCAYTVFTQQTQKGVLIYLSGERQANATTVGSLPLRAYYESQRPFLANLLARAEPPSCIEKGK